MSKPYLLFDAGGVLLFPDGTLIADAAAEVGVEVDVSRAYDAHFAFAYDFDRQTWEAGEFNAIPGQSYADHLFRSVGAPEDQLDALTRALAELDTDRCLWAATQPWVRPALDELRAAGYGMSIISNSDGRVALYLERAGLVDCFDTIVDSALIGIEKPDPAIFHHALDQVGLKPADALFFGDVYHIDVLGAAQAGIAAVHVDPLGNYADWTGARIQDIRQALSWLADREWPEDGQRLLETVCAESDFPR